DGHGNLRTKRTGLTTVPGGRAAVCAAQHSVCSPRPWRDAGDQARCPGRANVTGRMLPFLGRRRAHRTTLTPAVDGASALVLVIRLPACQRKKGLNHTVHGPSPV